MESFNGASSLKTWIYRIAVHEASNRRRWWFRHKSKETSMENSAEQSFEPGLALKDRLVDEASSPYDDCVRTELRDKVEAALAQVPEPYRTALVLRDRGPRRVSPFFIPGRLINLASGYVSIAHSLKGPNHAVVTACSTGAHAIGDAGRLIALGDADVMLAGGTESPVNRISLAGFAACRALSTGFNDTPERASRPYDRDRDGFVMGEGAGAVMLEEYEHAQRRGARIYGELIGYGLSGDAYHITAPAEDGDGAFRCMSAAIRRAGISPSGIDYINAHGTSTPLGDEIELKAVERLVGNAAGNIAMSSTKSSIGHLLGAAGAVEAIFCLLALRDGVVPPTLNLDNPSIATSIDLVPHKARQRAVEVALSNSFGFGGTNASLIFRKLAQ